jgi:hypothetical protein
MSIYIRKYIYLIFFYFIILIYIFDFHYRTWLYSDERLLHITFYTFASLIRDHNEPRFEALKAKEIKFCRIIFDAHVCIMFIF